MELHRMTRAVAALATLGLSTTAAIAEARWLKLVAQECDLEPGGVCNIEVARLADAPTS
jgi:hypothetical protein